MTQSGCLPEWAALAHVILGGLTTLLTVWLSYRRKRADRERRKFYWQMRQKHGLSTTEPERRDAAQGKFL